VTARDGVFHHGANQTFIRFHRTRRLNVQIQAAMIHAFNADRQFAFAKRTARQALWDTRDLWD